MPRRLLLLLFVFALAACGQPAAQTPTATPIPVAPTAEPAAATTQPTPAGPTAKPGPTTDPRLPTAPPRITPGPTAAPFALQAGWWDGAVCYEIFVRSFYDSDGDGIGDINGLIERLDYVNDGDPDSQQDLGANCIWLMPISESTSYHGYDVTDYYTIEQDYGTNDDFKRLVAEAEARGIKIIIDLVLNHTSVEHPWFKEAAADPNSPYRDWYLWSEIKPPYRGPFSNNQVWHQSPAGSEFYYGVFWSGMPDLNYRNPAVTAEAEKISRFWVEEMGVAGFRLDAIKHLIEYQIAQQDTPETLNWLRSYRQFLERELPGTFTVGEIFGGDADSLERYYPDQLDSYFEFAVAQQTRAAANTGLASLYMEAVEDAATRLPFQRWAPFLTNHDQNRVMSELDDDMSKARVAALGLLTLPGMPFVYYGEEIGMLGVKPDERIRTPMQWTKEEFGGFTAGIPWQNPQQDYPTKNVAAQDADPASLLNLYRRLIHLHVNTPALAGGEFVPVEASKGGVASFLRLGGNDAALVLINFSNNPVEDLALDLAASTLPPGEYSLEPLYGDPAASPPALTIGPNGTISAYGPLPALPPRDGLILRLSAQP